MKLHHDVVVSLAGHQLRAIDAFHQFALVNHDARGVLLRQNLLIFNVISIEQAGDKTGVLDVHADVCLGKREFHILFRFVHHTGYLNHGFTGNDDVALRHGIFQRHGTARKLVCVRRDNCDLFAKFEQYAGQNRFTVVLRGGKYRLTDHIAAIVVIHLDRERIARKAHLRKIFRRFDALQTALCAAAGDIQRLSGERYLGDGFRQLPYNLRKELTGNHRKTFLLNRCRKNAFLLQHQIGAFQFNAVLGCLQVDAF